MPTYHFVKSKEDLAGLGDNYLPPNRLTVHLNVFREDDLMRPYSRKMTREFDKAHFYDSNQEAVLIGNCEGSTIFVDRTRQGINKLHLGELTVKRPHAESDESHGKEGPRVDLWRFDLPYAEEWFSELERWRNPEYRRDLVESYASLRWYCIPHRVKQLRISPQGLENRLGELEQHLAELRALPWESKKRDLVSRHAHIMETRYRQVVEMTCKAAREKDRETKKATRKVRMKPKFIVQQNVILQMGRIRASLQAVLSYICPKIDLEQARRYWQEVDAWEKM